MWDNKSIPQDTENMPKEFLNYSDNLGQHDERELQAMLGSSATCAVYFSSH